MREKLGTADSGSKDSCNTNTMMWRWRTYNLRTLQDAAVLVHDADHVVLGFVRKRTSCLCRAPRGSPGRAPARFQDQASRSPGTVCAAALGWGYPRIASRLGEWRAQGSTRSKAQVLVLEETWQGSLFQRLPAIHLTKCKTASSACEFRIR